MGGRELLVEKNTSLMGQVTAQRKELNELRRRLQSLQESQAKWQDTTACVSSLWDELNQTIGFLQFKVGADRKTERETDGKPERRVKQIAAPALEPGSAQALLNEANPFLAHLLQAYLPDDPAARKAAVSLAEDLTATEAALRARMKDTMQAATSVLQSVDELSASSASTRELPGPEENRLSSLVALLRAENGRLLKESVQENMALKNLEASLADKEAELVVLTRRLAIAGSTANSGEKQAASSIPASPRAEADVATTANTANTGNAANPGEPRLELDLAIQEVERRDKLIATLERYVVPFLITWWFPGFLVVS